MQGKKKTQTQKPRKGCTYSPDTVQGNDSA